MQISSKYKLVTLAAVASLACAVGYDYLPEKRLQVYPAEGIETFTWSDTAHGGSTQVTVLSQSPLRWRCVVQEEGDFFKMCGTGMLALRDGLPIDVSAYSSLTVKLKVDSPDERMRVAFTSWLGEYSRKNGGTEQFNYLTVPLKDLAQGVALDLRQFSTAEWWLSEHEPPIEFTSPYLEQVRGFSFEVGAPPKPGIHEFELELIELRGRFISSSALFRTILLFWMALAIPYSVLRYMEMKRRLAREQQQREQLAQYSNELEKKSEKLKELSTFDPLTGALNRNGLNDALEELKGISTRDQKVGLIILDLDHFKRVNDQRGHDAGDEVLRTVAGVLRAQIRGSDRLARWGGEEFLVLCPHTQEAGVVGLAEKLREAIASIAFNIRPPLKATASLGVGCFTFDEPFEDAFKRVDEALYRAKHAGRNCTMIAEAKSQRKSAEAVVTP